MPLIWRQLVKSYLRVFLLCATGFITLLLVLRFQDIARFAASGAPSLFLIQFIAYQIPYILPLAIPISCLIAAILLFQNMSRYNELTTLRACGLGLFPIIFPVIICATLLTLLNFTIVAEITQNCRAASKGLVKKMTSINPLCLLNKEKFIKLNDSYIDMKVLKPGKYSEDVIFIMPSLSNQRLGLTLIKKLYLENDNLIGKNVTFISSVDSKSTQNFDHIMIENQMEMETRSSLLSEYLHNADKSTKYPYLSLRLNRAKYQFERDQGSKKIRLRSFQELLKGISLSLGAFTFTLIGIAFGIQSSRKNNLKDMIWAVGLSAFYCISFMVARSIKHDYFLPFILYLLPHPVIILVCLNKFHQIARGKC